MEVVHLVVVLVVVVVVVGSLICHVGRGSFV